MSLWRFKSDRGGIETKISSRDISRDILFKSDRGGIETQNSKYSNPVPTLFKSDRGGIETQSGADDNTANRVVQIRPWRDWNINMTEVYEDSYWVQIRPWRDWNISVHQWASMIMKFKSDRGGIETGSHAQARTTYLHRSNQTVAGLKHLYKNPWGHPIACSNQTVAGLKHCCIYSSMSGAIGFKSDRGGIETRD